MIRLVASLIMILSLVSCSTIDHAFKSTARIETGSFICSGTYIEPSLFLTANHCMGQRAVPDSLKISGQHANILAWARDSSDHIILVLDIQSPFYAKISKVDPKVKDRVFYYGNPATLYQIYREGYVVGTYQASILIDANGWKGDSGAGVFDSSGKLIGVINSLLGAPEEGFFFMEMDPLTFTEADIVRLGYDCSSLPLCVK